MVYGLLLAVVLYREMSLRQVWRAVVAAAILSGMVLLIVAAASTFAWILTIAQLPQRMIELISAHDLGPSFFLLCTVPLMIVAGSIVEGLPAILILAPLLMPIAVRLGINPVHYSMVLLIAMGTGSFMPPVGIGFYICCAVCGSRIEASSRAMVPYLLMLIVGLLIVAFVPWVDVGAARCLRPRAVEPSRVYPETKTFRTYKERQDEIRRTTTARPRRQPDAGAAIRSPTCCATSTSHSLH